MKSHFTPATSMAIKEVDAKLESTLRRHSKTPDKSTFTRAWRIYSFSMWFPPFMFNSINWLYRIWKPIIMRNEKNWKFRELF